MSAPFQPSRHASVAMYSRAARAAPGAFLELAGWHYDQAGLAPGHDMVRLVRAAEHARLAEQIGATQAAPAILLFLLNEQATAFRALGWADLEDEILAEAVSLADRMAEDGDEDAARILASSAHRIAPTVLTAALQAQSIQGASR